MKRFFVNWLVIVAAVALASQLLPNQITYSSLTNLAIFALVLGVLNAIVRPVVKLVTCPINLLTLGLFSFVINAVMFWLAASLVAANLPGSIYVADFFTAFLAALIVSAVNLIAGLVLI